MFNGSQPRAPRRCASSCASVSAKRSTSVSLLRTPFSRRRSITPRGFSTVETDRFAFEVGDAARGWESWIDPRWEAILADRLALVGDFEADDPAGPAAVAEALAELSFVEEFGPPRVIWPDGLAVPLRLRRPVACGPFLNPTLRPQ